MKTMAWLMVGLLGSSVLAQSAGDMTDPTEILKKVDAAAKAVKSASYMTKYEGEGQQGKLTAEGSAVLMKMEGKEAKLRVEGTFTGSDGKTRSLVGGFDGENYYLIDHDNKKVYVDIDVAVWGSAARLLGNLFVAELNHPTPFNDEINGSKKELKGTVKVGDVDCYEVFVEYAPGGQQAIWRFGKNDLLPRGRQNIFPASERGPAGGNTYTVTKLVLDPTFVQDPFKLVIPEGYTKIEDFAP